MTSTVTGRFDDASATEPGGGGCLLTDRGNLPLHKLDVRATITGLVARTDVIQGFRNPHDVPLEATYIFPLPDRAAVTAMTLTAADRTIVAELHERARARQAYDDAIAQGRRAAIAEEERPDVFTMRVGNIAPGESVEVALTTVGPLPFEDGEATFRFPLVVAPRYIPGRAVFDEQAGAGVAPDTDRTPDASRISPPVLLPGFPNPVALSVAVRIDPAGLPLGPVQSSLHAITAADGVLRIAPGERVDRDFILRLPYGDAAGSSTALAVHQDPDDSEGTFHLTVIPAAALTATSAKDVVLLLDRSGSMQGWKMVAARRAAARIVDALGTADRFAVLTFDNAVEAPDGLPAGLVDATDRNRYRAVEHLSRADARGGTELREPLMAGLGLLAEGGASRDRVLVLVTDGQVGNEDDILDAVNPLLTGVRVHTVGIDQAVNAGFLGRLAAAGRGRCELVESEDRLDAAMSAIQRRIASPLVTDIGLDENDSVVADTVSPRRLPDLFSGVPYVVRGRYRSTPPTVVLTGQPWRASAHAITAVDDALRPIWARAVIRDLEDDYASAPSEELAQRIVETSLRFGVLSRFTGFVAVDSRVGNLTGELHRIVQPVDLPAGWAPVGAMPLQALGGGALESRRFSTASTASAFRRPVQQRALHRDGRPTELVALRKSLRQELRQLDQRPSGEREQREVLDDLATRLDAIVRHLRTLGLDATALAALVELLRDESVALDERWTRAQQVLAQLADRGEREFWKRRQ
jgi:Ca-activated chloride channel family protein